MDKINILVNINTDYIQHCGVMLCSLFYNNPFCIFSVSVLYTNLDGKEQEKLKQFVENNNNEISFYKVDTTNMIFPNVTSHYISSEAYLRVLVGNYLPKSISKILYLDSDMVVLGSIKELYDTDIEGQMLAAIYDANIMGYSERINRLGIPANNGYFNSGVMLLNMEYWRNKDIAKKSLDYIRNNANRIYNHDQDVLNVLAIGMWRPISFKWNMLNVFFLKNPPIPIGHNADLKQSLNDVRIAHFSGPIKPWIAWERHPYHSEYYKYLKMTPWKNYRPSLQKQWNAYKFPKNIIALTGLGKLLIKMNLI